LLDKQRNRRSRISLPATNLEAPRWGLVCRTYQPELTDAWAACTHAFSDEANQDPLFEQYVTNYQNELHALYRNLIPRAVPVFQFDSQAVGLAALGRQYIGFGTGFVDIDNDGWQDIVIANGHVIRYPSGAGVRQLPVLLRSKGNEGKDTVHFEDITTQGGPYFRAEHQGRGLAIGDVDNDGRPDLVISHLNEPVTLLRNEAGSGHHWLGVELIDKKHADLAGAKLTVEVGDRRLTYFAKGGSSYLSSSDRRHLIGLGEENKVGRVTVVWPSGKEQLWNALSIDRYWQLVAGEAEARAPAGAGSDER
jgi:hypothetical protein